MPNFFSVFSPSRNIICVHSYVPDNITLEVSLCNQNIGKRTRNRLLLFLSRCGSRNKFAGGANVQPTKARLSVPRREPTVAALADEGVSALRLRYFVDVHHLDCPLLFGCQKSNRDKREKGQQILCHQALFYILISDMASCHFDHFYFQTNKQQLRQWTKLRDIISIISSCCLSVKQYEV